MPFDEADRQESESTRLERRTYVKGIGGISATTLAGLAGCLGDDTGNGDGDGDDTGNGNGNGNGDGNGTQTPPDQLQALGAVNFLGAGVWQAWEQGVRAACEEFGVDISVSAAQGDLNQQMSTIDSALGSGTNMLLGQAPSNAGVNSWIDAATQANIPFVSIWVTAPWTTPVDVGEEFLEFQIPDHIQNGEIMAEYLFESMGGEGLVAYISGAPGTAGNFAIDRGLQNVASEYPDIELTDPIPANWTREGGREAMSQMVSRYGDDIDAVWGQNDAESMGALDIAKERNLDVDIVGLGGIKAALEEMQTDKAEDEPRIIGNSYLGYQWQGGWSIAKMYDWHHGWRPEVPMRMIWSGNRFITRDQDTFSDTLPDGVTWYEPQPFLDMIYNSDETPYDWAKMSVVESGEDGWDPQNSMTSIKQDEFEVLRWTEDNRPDGYEVPDVYDDTEMFENFDSMIDDRFQSDPFA